MKTVSNPLPIMCRLGILLFLAVGLAMPSPAQFFSDPGNHTTVTYHPNGFGFDFGLQAQPITMRAAQMDFQYVDGDAGAAYALDTVTAGYRLDRQTFNSAMVLGLHYDFQRPRLRLSLRAVPQFNSFRSNVGKNERVYGVQFDLGLCRHGLVRQDGRLRWTAGAQVSRNIGGFGITAGGARNKPFLKVNGNDLCDPEIGFHIIDQSWAAAALVGLEWPFFSRWHAAVQAGYQFQWARKSRMNFAGLLEDGTVQWNAKQYDDADVALWVDGQRVRNGGLDRLPFQQSGIVLALTLSCAFK
jgi:hypothetical protein